MSLTLYHVQWCPECAVVRDALAQLGLAYEEVVVPDFRPMRKQSSQYPANTSFPFSKTATPFSRKRTRYWRT